MLSVTFYTDVSTGFVRPCVMAYGDHYPGGWSSASIRVGNASASALRGRDYTCWTGDVSATNLNQMAPFVSGSPVFFSFDYYMSGSAPDAQGRGSSQMEVRLFGWSIVDSNGNASVQASFTTPEPDALSLVAAGALVLLAIRRGSLR